MIRIFDGVAAVHLKLLKGPCAAIPLWTYGMEIVHDFNNFVFSRCNIYQFSKFTTVVVQFLNRNDSWEIF